jgi:hypothetical protein
MTGKANWTAMDLLKFLFFLALLNVVGFLFFLFAF